MKTASATEQLQTSSLLVKLPSGKTEHHENMYDESTLCELLFDEIESLTGIPILHGLQMISCGSRMMHPSIPIHQLEIENGKHLILSVKGIGGGGSDSDESIILHCNTFKLTNSYLILLYICMQRM